MKSRKWISRAFSCTVLSCVAACILNMIALAAGAEAWGFCYGGNPYQHKISYIKSNYVGDYGIFEHLMDTDGQSMGGSRDTSYADGGTYEMGSGTVIGYNSRSTGDVGSDKSLYNFFISMKSAGGSTLKKTFDKGGKLYKANKPHSKDEIYNALKPENAEYYSPLNVLRMMQLYMVTRGGESKCFIGGWPVQTVVKSETYVYKIEGARTIKMVYSTFTGMKYDESKSLKAISKDSNCTKDSICYKLYDGKLTMKKAAEQLKSKLESAGVLCYSGKRLITAGNMTYEEYYSRALNDDRAIRYSAANGEVPLSQCFKTYIDSIPDGQLMDANKRQDYYVMMFRYLEEYGIKFNTAEDAEKSDDDEIKSIFKGGGTNLFFEVGADGKVKNLNSDSDRIANNLNNLMKKYSQLPSNKYALGKNIDKPRMNDMAEALVENMRKTVNADVEPDGLQILKQYCTWDEDSPVGKAMSAAVDGAEDANAAKSINKSKSKTTAGFNILSKINDVYVTKFFLDLCTSSGNSDSSTVNNEYNKIVNILASDTCSKDKPTMEQCFNMMYSMKRIKDEGALYNYTFFAKSNMQIGSILKYCKTNLKRVHKHFYEDKIGSEDQIIDFGRAKEKGATQRYSDWCECYTAISSMGAKAYGRTHPNEPSQDNATAFMSAYDGWLSTMKSGKTKYVKGIQHQDGFVPYGLKEDSQELKDATKEYFTDSKNSLDGKNKITKYDKNAQGKILKWGIDTEELNETIKENFWLTMVNNTITLVGILMLIVGFTLVTLYVFDHVSENLYGVVRRVTFGRMEYSFDKKTRRGTLLKFLVFISLAAFMFDGTLMQWAIYLLQLAYRMFTVK